MLSVSMQQTLKICPVMDKGRTCDQQVAGSNPDRYAPLPSATLGKFFLYTHCVTHMPLSKAYNLVGLYQPMGGDARRRWRCETAGLVENNDSLPTGLWLLSLAG